ncbi:UDP-glucose/GDP-mannose dehydrogenase family protein [Psychrobacter sp. Cmf 22.2]|uniref:UDP-glucose/GDP-mannose dehydrogenase family protein n=1 Tax=Psychrobacter sp. Cmf 22.2 TaxID=1926478 RepID=UPI0009471B02|nr:UDP-glucose/GDP-mannose dehydrogenase family protein [Psychrobacter sp. Cmf 22.2]OLF37509.1 UDP-glucose 6-dehydrogenase [Psychrobacter sp. Cmf 22.2]
MSINPSHANNINKESAVCVIVGHGVEAITSAVVLASLGQTVHLYADIEMLEQQLQQYSFERHLQALWQMYDQQKQIVSQALPSRADKLLQIYEATDETTGHHASPQGNEQHTKVALYWLFLDSIKSVWPEESWITAFNHSHQQTISVIISGIEQLGHISALSQRLQRAWVYYIPFVFLQDGDAYSSMLNPSLWLLGEKTTDSNSQHLKVLQPLMQQAHARHCADVATIEFARSSIMSMLATRVSFMNEMSRLADSHDVDIQQVSHIMGLDERVGSSYLQAGWGFGGNTLPTELLQLNESGQASRVDMPLLQSVIDINEDQKELIFRKFWQYFDGFIDNKTVMIWGGSYKSGSGRTVGSAIHPLLALLWSYNIQTLVYSEKAQTELETLYGKQPLLVLVDDPYARLDDTQALFIMSWPLDSDLDVNQINHTAQPIFDAQNALTFTQIDSLIGGYMGIGRAK